MGCHIYIEDLQTGQFTFTKWTRLPPAYYDKIFTTKEQVKTFVNELITGKFLCHAEQINIPYTECCTDICREHYKFTEQDVAWVVEIFEETKNQVVCA